MDLALQPSAVDFLAGRGYDPAYGARPVKRALQRELQTMLAQTLLRGEFAEGDIIRVLASPDNSCLLLQKAEEPYAGSGAPARLGGAAVAKAAAETVAVGAQPPASNGPQA